MKTATQTLNQIAAMTAMFARQPRLALTALERGDAEGLLWRCCWPSWR